MRETKVSQARKNVPLNGGATASVQISNMSIEEATFYGGAQPYFRFWIFTVGPLSSAWTILQGDLLTDVRNIDPRTGKNTVYRVTGNPNPYLTSFWAIPTEQFIGK